MCESLCFLSVHFLFILSFLASLLMSTPYDLSAIVHAYRTLNHFEDPLSPLSRLEKFTELVGLLWSCFRVIILGYVEDSADVDKEDEHVKLVSDALPVLPPINHDQMVAVYIYSISRASSYTGCTMADALMDSVFELAEEHTPWKSVSANVFEMSQEKIIAISREVISCLEHCLSFAHKPIGSVHNANQFFRSMFSEQVRMLARGFVDARLLAKENVVDLFALCPELDPIKDACPELADFVIGFCNPAVYSDNSSVARLIPALREVFSKYCAKKHGETPLIQHVASAPVEEEELSEQIPVETRAAILGLTVAEYNLALQLNDVVLDHSVVADIANNSLEEDPTVGESKNMEEQFDKISNAVKDNAIWKDCYQNCTALSSTIKYARLADKVWVQQEVARDAAEDEKPSSIAAPFVDERRMIAETMLAREREEDEKNEQIRSQVHSWIDQVNRPDDAEDKKKPNTDILSFPSNTWVLDEDEKNQFRTINLPPREPRTLADWKRRVTKLDKSTSTEKKPTDYKLTRGRSLSV